MSSPVLAMTARSAADDVEHAPRELRAAGAPGEDDDGAYVAHGSAGSPVSWMPAWVL